jgi:hypothetical protein
VFDEAMARSNPLDYESALASPIELHVVTTSVDGVAPRVLARFGSVDELRTALWASVCLPFAAGPPVAWQGTCSSTGVSSRAIPSFPRWRTAARTSC